MYLNAKKCSNLLSENGACWCLCVAGGGEGEGGLDGGFGGERRFFSYLFNAISLVATVLP